MTRENFKVTYNGNEVIKHKWNSAIRETESIVRLLAKEEQTVYELIESVSNREECYYTSGKRVWKSHKGETVTFIITKE